MTKEEVNQLNPLVWAFVGDSVFTLAVRSWLARHKHIKAGGLHDMAKQFVSAVAQSRLLARIEEKLTQEEMDIMRRSRNCHNNTRAKNASLADYKRATGMEGLLGFLELSEQKERLDALLPLLLDESVLNEE